MTGPCNPLNAPAAARVAAGCRGRAMLAAALFLAALACSAPNESGRDAAVATPETTPIRIVGGVAGGGTERVAGEVFEAEVAVDSPTRYRGLSGRTEIARNGGMLFVLPKPQVFQMVMRDCPIPIDVAFLDGSGRVVAIHEMVPELPRTPDETPFRYEQRLPVYGSGVPVQFALETRGGRFAELGVQPGQRLHFAAQDLIARSR